MSRSIDIEFEFEQMPSLVTLLREIGENDIEPRSNGALWFTSNGDYDWERGDPSECLAVVLAMRRTLGRSESVGFGITWRLISPTHRVRRLWLLTMGLSFIRDLTDMGMAIT